ncbi:two-component system regulatory protein YycI [Microbacteriaceae bacterium 4G12]
MDWSKIKTIFIVTFLILDLFLVYQYTQKRNSNQLELMSETKVEDQLAEDKITYVDLPKDPLKEAYITGKSKEFKEEDIKGLNKQTATLQDSKTITSKLKEAVHVPKNDKGYFFEEFLRTYILEGQKYKYWKTDDKEKKIYFFQQYKGKNVFYNQNASLVLDINENSDIVSYTQTMLTDVSEMGGSQDIITSLKALEALYLKNEIKQGSRVTKVELGYYNYTVLNTSAAGIQVIAPTWHFVVNGKDDYFVNAIEGQLIKIDK